MADGRRLVQRSRGAHQGLFVRDQADLSRGALIFWLWVDGVALLAVALAFALFVRAGFPSMKRPDG